ncbi:type III secretion apparatus needle protein [Yersinia artesiana]|uniref:type III secretion apparatus needle protein n=1 Tax=Yersinia artesiana TaxID=2890315 RepID=UPI0015815E59|nr:type III secretion apparatus needle protein [Yersinia artesiana]
MPAIEGILSTGSWEASAYEIPGTNSKWGMAYRVGGLMNGTIKSIADELKTTLETTAELDNPLTLAKVAALNGNYNASRQLQSNLGKSTRDTAMAIIRNV